MIIRRGYNFNVIFIVPSECNKYYAVVLV